MAHYGCIPDEPDERDHMFAAAMAPTADDFTLPDSHDLTAMFPPVMDQGPYSSCTAHSTTAAYRFNLLNTDRFDMPLSRAALYWDSGVLEGNTADVGRQIRDVVKVMATKGVAREQLWGYDRILHEPPDDLFVDAQAQAIIEYQRVNTDRRSLNTAIYLGHPVIVGIPIFPAFESDEVAATGIVPMPGRLETPVGWHSVLHGGYEPEWDILLNSWNTWFGLPEKKGYFKLPSAYLPKYAQDCWTIFLDK